MEERERNLKKDNAEKEAQLESQAMELSRYKDLLSLREREISELKTEKESVSKTQDALQRKIKELEKEKTDLTS